MFEYLNIFFSVTDSDPFTWAIVFHQWEVCDYIEKLQTGRTLRSTRIKLVIARMVKCASFWLVIIPVVAAICLVFGTYTPFKLAKSCNLFLVCSIGWCSSTIFTLLETAKSFGAQFDQEEESRFYFKKALLEASKEQDNTELTRTEEGGTCRASKILAAVNAKPVKGLITTPKLKRIQSTDSIVSQLSELSPDAMRDKIRRASSSRSLQKRTSTRPSLCTFGSMTSSSEASGSSQFCIFV